MARAQLRHTGGNIYVRKTRIEGVTIPLVRSRTPACFETIEVSIEKGEQDHATLDASAVMVNDHSALRTDWMPFAGRRASGYGGGIPYTAAEMSAEKMVVYQEIGPVGRPRYSISAAQ
ncbi:hypothetical protein GCM10010520_55810 [Rhizobium viscosum]